MGCYRLFFIITYQRFAMFPNARNRFNVLREGFVPVGNVGSSFAMVTVFVCL